MARVFRVPKATVDKTTGKRRRLKDEKGKFIYLPLYYGQFTSWDGRRKTVALSQSKAEALQLVAQLQQREKEIRLGLRPIPSVQQKHVVRPIGEVIEEYLEWGGAQGGRRGRPWSPVHARDRRRYLADWQKELGLKELMDLSNILPRVEKSVRQKLAAGAAGKTVSNCLEALRSFCTWAKTRKYIGDDPLGGLSKIDKTPKSKRRLITTEEIARLLAASPPDRRLLYEVALKSGLRANELRSLTIDHLDVGQCGLILEAEWTKNRTAGFQPLPRDLVERLAIYSADNKADEAYADRFARGNHEPSWRDRPLLYVPTNCAITLDRDLKAAGIDKVTTAGKLDFHAFRVAFINMVINSGADVKTAQTLARHSTAEMTLNVYGRAQGDRLAEAVEKMDRKLSGPTTAE